ncbi:hypothetical protein ECG_05815 [Echinococcus granulosus]|nr:hypothetical protein ECG_05815 [Echinococcus granulosus]
MNRPLEDSYLSSTAPSLSSNLGVPYATGRSGKFGSGTGDIFLRMGRRVSQAFNLRPTYNKVNEEKLVFSVKPVFLYHTVVLNAFIATLGKRWAGF